MEEIYTDPRFIGKAFVPEARKRGFTIKQINEFLAKEAGHQLTKQRGHVDYFPLWGPPGTYQADLMFIEGKTVLTLINVNSRFAYAYPLQNKKGGGVLGALIKFVHDSGLRSPCCTIQTDNGPEFLNKQVQDFFKRVNITHETVEVNDHRGQGMIERFNRTFRNLATLYKNTTGQGFANVTQQLIDNYNGRVHSSILMAPEEATDLTGFAIRASGYQNALKQFQRFKVGDTVRKLINKSSKFEKGAERWSQALFTITGKEQNHFVLSDGSTARHYEIQLVNPESKTIERDLEGERQEARKEKKKTRDLRKEGISEYKEDEFDGSVFVGRRVKKGKLLGTIEKYEKSRRGDLKRTFDWNIVFDNGETETMNFPEIEKYLV